MYDSSALPMLQYESCNGQLLYSWLIDLMEPLLLKSETVHLEEL
jgi:hypothetical protein